MINFCFCLIYYLLLPPPVEPELLEGLLDEGEAVVPLELLEGAEVLIPELFLGDELLGVVTLLFLRGGVVVLVLFGCDERTGVLGRTPSGLVARTGRTFSLVFCLMLLSLTGVSCLMLLSRICLGASCLTLLFSRTAPDLTSRIGLTLFPLIEVLPVLSERTGFKRVWFRTPNNPGLCEYARLLPGRIPGRTGVPL